MADNTPNEDKKPDGVVNPQTAASDTPKVVDNSAPADNNIQSIKNKGKTDGKDRTDPNIADKQPGDPSVKVKRADGTVEERDATLDEAKAVPQSETKPAQGNPAPAGNEVEGKDVEQAGVERQEREAKGVEPVKLKNPSGKVVEVNPKTVIDERMFEHGFVTVKGESYPDEVKAAEKAYKDAGKAAEAYTGSDQGDNGQDLTNDDDNSRRGTATLESRQAELKSEDVAPTSTSREDGQIFDPSTGEPRKGSRLASALNKDQSAE